MSAERCEQLLDAWLDGADAGAAAELDALLRVDDAARARYVQLVRLDARIRSTMKHATGEEPISRRVRQASGPSGTAREPFHRSRSTSRFVVGAIAALLAIAVIGALHRHDDQPRGDVVARRSADGRSVLVGEKVAAEGDKSVNLVLTDDTTHVDLAPGAVARIAREARGERVRLDHGRISVDVSPRSTDRPFIVETPHGTATVIGTAFTVDVTSATRFAVARGKVAVSAAGATSYLLPGDAALCVRGDGPRVARRVALQLSELSDASAWSYHSDNVTIATDPDGLLGPRSVRLTCTSTVPGDGGAAALFPQPRDLSGGDGLSLVISGPGVDRTARILLELLTATDNSPPNDADPYEQRCLADIVYEASNFSGWREVRIPYWRFYRGSVQPDRATLAAISGLRIIMSTGVAVSVERIGVYDASTGVEGTDVERSSGERSQEPNPF